MADVKWIKLSTSLFDNRKIRQIECLPEGNAFIVVWMKLLCLAGNINDGGYIYFTKDMPYTEEMLSTQFGMPLETVIMALETFEKFEMIEMFNDIICISNWEKYQNIEGMEKIREQNRIRKQRQRQRQKEECHVTCHDNVTQCHATEEEKNKKEEEEREKEKENITCKQVVDLFHSICVSYPSVKALSEARKKAIKARLKAYNIDDFKTLFEKAEASSFLKGSNDRNWSANFDWLIKDANMAKVIDGNYDNRSGSAKQASNNSTSQQLDNFYNMAAEWAEGGE